MKLYITMDWRKIDSGVQGEEFDQELESQLEEIDIEGWELSGVSVARERPDTTNIDKIKTMCISAQHIKDGYTEYAEQLATLVLLTFGKQT